jgi:mannose-6-phosphate isomerase-like protein (cupin superfamily)
VPVFDAALARSLPAEPDVLAPDGSEVRILASRPGGSMAHFRLKAGQVARAVAHRSVEEIWYVIAGEGRIWRKAGADEEVLRLQPGQSLAISVGMQFQFRNDGTDNLDIIAVTMPPWPGEGEAYFVDGPWEAVL